MLRETERGGRVEGDKAESKVRSLAGWMRGSVDSTRRAPNTSSLRKLLEAKSAKYET